MNRFTKLAHAAVVVATLCSATAAFADYMPYPSNLVSTDPTQKGRLSRNAIPQDFSGTEAYPGLIAGSSTLSYHYHVYSVDVGATPYVQIYFDSLSSFTFIAAYQSAYYVTNFGTSWLGDEGSSVDAFGTDVNFFGVKATPNSKLLIVVNETTPNSGVGSTNPFTISAQGFTDVDYDGAVDLAITSGGAVIPEPSTLLLLAPLALVAGLKTRRRRAAVVA